MPTPMKNFRLWAAYYGGVDSDDEEAVNQFYEVGIESLSDYQKNELFEKLLSHELPPDKLVLYRDKLRLGKYTRAYADLTPDQLNGLLWLLGEWSGRVRDDGSCGRNAGGRRAKAAMDALREFRRKPLGLDEVTALMREAARGKSPDEPKVCVNHGCNNPRRVWSGGPSNVCFDCFSKGMYDW